MSIRKVLVPIDGTEATRGALLTGFAVARRFSAHVDVLHPRVDPIEAVTFAGEGMSGEVVQELIDLTQHQGEVRAAVARAMFADACAAAGVEEGRPKSGQLGASFHDPRSRDEDAVAHLGRLCDLIVATRPAAGSEPITASVLNAALFETGHPVLVAGAAPPPEVHRHVLVAWNGSLEAARSITAALPFLAAAERVTVAHGGDLEEGCSPHDLVEYFACHDITATTLALPMRQPVAEALVAAAHDVDLLVMGAYTHGRLWQLVLGGVTRHMLEEAALPLFMAH
jgi:Universal stress protein UspA and related nucleotide-binding proteins